MYVHIRQANLADPRDANGIVTLINTYALDPMGGGQPLSSEVKQRLVPALRDHPTTLVLLAFVDEAPIGIAVCFVGFSTFRAQPLLNIHDLAVLPQYRGEGVGHALLLAAEDYARRNGCCKLTLEVLERNSSARALYRRFGFDDSAVESPESTRFLAKTLEALRP